MNIRRQSIYILLFFALLAAACGPSPEEQATMTATIQTATAASWTRTPTSTHTFTPTSTDTPTATYTSTNTLTPTITFTPTFNFPKVTVNVAAAACMYGPAKAYLYHWTLQAGDTGTVYGRAPVGSWMYVFMDRVGKWCWISPFVVDLVGDPNTVIVESISAHLPWANNLYAAPERIFAERQGDQVIVSWSEVWMTEDDDRGYFLDVWVCQDGSYLWMPIGIPNQYTTTYTFTDQAGCPEPSGGQIFTVEKHGYTDPRDIPWPPYDSTKP